MNPNREEFLFQMALEKPPEKRAAFLDAMCEGDAALRSRLEALLAAHEETNSFPEPAEPVRTIKLDLDDALPGTPRPNPKSLAAAPLAVFRQALMKL